MVNFIGRILLGMIKNLLGMKLIWILAIAVGVLILIFIIKLIHNIVKGSFDVAKFAGGFNVFSGPVQGKLIYYFIIFAIVSAVALGIYGKFTQDTYENNYKNNIRGNENVYVDQRQIIQYPEDTLLIGIKLFGLRIGINAQSKPKPVTIINNNIKPQPPKPTPKPEPFTLPLWSKIVIGFAGLIILIIGTHYITLLIRKIKASRTPTKPVGL